MSQADNDTTELLAAVRRDCFLAASDDNWTADRILGIANDCTLTLAAALKRAKQDWFQHDFELVLVASQPDYDVPESAMWSSIENAFLIDKTTGLIVSTVNNVSSSNRIQYQATNVGIDGIPQVCWLNHYKIVLSPSPDSNAVASYSVTVSAYRRPGQLVETDEVVNVTAVNSVTQTLTTTARPSTWTTDTYTSGTPYRLDLYGRNRPNTLVLQNQTLTAPSTTAFAFSPSITTAQFASISVGDVVTMKGTSPFPDLPDEAIPFLRQMIKKTILTAQTDVAALQVYLTEKADEAANFLRGMANRHDGRPKKLSLYNAAAGRFVGRGYWGR